MNKNKIIEILEDWNFWHKELDTGIERGAYLGRLKEHIQGRQVLVITGPRQSGKSYIMRQFASSLIKKGTAKERILMVNFEDPRFSKLEAKDLDEIFITYLEFLRPAEIPFVFLDEVQEVDCWEKWVRTIQELKKAHLIISGSNAKLLSRELATVLTGRHLDITVFPLSFSEYLNFNNITAKDALSLVPQQTAVKGLLRKYLIEGGYPEVALRGNSKEILLRYFNDILYKDLIKRYKIRKSEELKNLIVFYLTQTASLISYNSAAKPLGLTANTVEKFSGYFETAYLLFFVKRFSFKVREQHKSPRKLYSVDNGLANAAGFRFSENWGRAAETAVFLEIERQRSLDPALEIYYWKDIHHREVDFIIKDGLKVKQLIQVCWDPEQPKTREREMRNLKKAMREFGLSESLVITEDKEAEEKNQEGKITFIPLWKWLLNPWPG